MSLTPAVAPPGPDPFHRAPDVRVRSLRAFWESIRPTLSFLMETQAHVYAFAVAANALISFFPFLVVMIIICRSVFHWEAAVNAIFFAVSDYFPSTFNATPMAALLDSAARRQHGVPWFVLLLLLFTANGIFEPLEVAFNRVWRVTRNRSFLRNQVLGLGLIFLCGVLTLASVCGAAADLRLLRSSLAKSGLVGALSLLSFKIVALPLLMLMIFLIYWILPNRRIPIRRLIPAAVIVGLLLEVLKYVNLLTWPWLRARLELEVPPFVQSISIILWAFCAAMLILAGAEWSARVHFLEHDEGSGTP